MKTLILFGIGFWLITTMATEQAVQGPDGSYKLIKKQYCVEVQPQFKGGDLIVKDSGQEVVLRVKDYIIERVDQCP